MRFKVDENLPACAVTLLRESGFEADSVADENLCGAEDATLSGKVRSEGRILITLDLDFSDIRTYPPGEHAGIIVLRAKMQDRHSVLALLRRLIPLLKTRAPQGELWIAGPDRIRMRPGL